MQLNNSFTVALSPDQAWPVLTDVERVVSCMPGATLDSVDGDEIHATMKVKLGPIQLSYKGVAHFVEVDEAGRRLVIEAAGKDTKGAGTASATVHMSLHERDGGSEVRVLTDLAVTGKPAQFGRGAMQEVSSKMIDRFARSLEQELALDHAAVVQVGSKSGALGASPALGGVSPGVSPGHRRDEDALDLRDFMGPIVKRLAPVAGGMILLGVIVAMLIRR
jgi:carbon monoxide dehydrogenase subunit G